MPSNQLKKGEAIDVTKYEIRGLWTGKGEDHEAAGVGDVEGYPFEPPDDLGGWLLLEIREKPDYRYFTLWARERIKPKAKPKVKKKSASSQVAPVAPDIAAIIDETNAAVTHQATPAKRKRGRPRSSSAKNGAATAPKETDNLPPPVANLPEYNGE